MIHFQSLIFTDSVHGNPGFTILAVLGVVIGIAMIFVMLGMAVEEDGTGFLIALAVFVLAVVAAIIGGLGLSSTNAGLLHQINDRGYSHVNWDSDHADIFYAEYHGKYSEFALINVGGDAYKIAPVVDAKGDN